MILRVTLQTMVSELGTGCPKGSASRLGRDAMASRDANGRAGHVTVWLRVALT
jgi:hypothetical protein